MTCLIATLKVKDDKLEDAKQLFSEVAAAVAEHEPGTLAYSVHQQQDDPTTLVVYERYASEEALAEHMRNLRAFGPRFAGVLDGRPSVQRLTAL